MKPTYQEIEQQLSESRREFTAADATIRNLERQLAAVASVPDERAAFEIFMEKRFKDCIDRRMVNNGDGEYFAWDMQVAWIVWQGRATILQGADGNYPVIQDWQTQAEKMAELYGSSFVVFRNGESPQCADPSKVIISFTDEGLWHGSAAPKQEVNRG